MSETAKPKTRIMTPKFRASYANVFVARAVNEGEDPKFSITMLFPKTDTEGLARLKAAAKAAIREKWGDNPPKKLRSPFRDGDDEDEDRGDAYKGMIFVYASAKSKPGIVDKSRNPIESADEFYSGCFARATVNAFAYDTKGNKGVSFGLNNIQMLAKGDHLDSRVSAEDDFDDYSDDDTGDGDNDTEDDNLGL
jgi:hypothetical protein